LLVAPSASATTFYVRATGDDGREGQSPGGAFASIQRAAARAGGGDTVIVGPGVYREGNIIPRGNGRRRELVRFVADREGAMTGDAPGMVLIDATGFDVGFRLAGRPWVVVNGFSVANANGEGIAVKSSADHSLIANCIVFSNRGRGVWVRDSRKVTLFNNLVYANGGTGIDFGGEGRGSRGGLALNNTVYANGLDGIRVEGLVPSPKVTVLQNVIAQNFGRGINVKTRSADGFVGQWNLNIDGYGSEARAAAFDLRRSPLLVKPSGDDQVLGEFGHADDDFRLRQLLAGQTEQSEAVDSGAMPASWFKLNRASTQTTGADDGGQVDLGFHYGNKTDFLSGFRRSLASRLRMLRSHATRCEELGDRARVARDRCVEDAELRRRLRRLCGLKDDGSCG
jgi:parallel beta-helix repeat protein